MAASSETERYTFDPDSGGGDEIAYLYRPGDVAEGVDGFDGVTEEEIARFHEQGYLVIHDAFSPTEVDAALAGLLDLIDGKNPAFKGMQFEAAPAICCRPCRRSGSRTWCASSPGSSGTTRGWGRWRPTRGCWRP